MRPREVPERESAHCPPPERTAWPALRSDSIKVVRKGIGGHSSEHTACFFVLAGRTVVRETALLFTVPGESRPGLTIVTGPKSHTVVSLRA